MKVMSSDVGTDEARGRVNRCRQKTSIDVCREQTLRIWVSAWAHAGDRGDEKERQGRDLALIRVCRCRVPSHFLQEDEVSCQQFVRLKVVVEAHRRELVLQGVQNAGIPAFLSR